jgi:putative transposase
LRLKEVSQRRGCALLKIGRSSFYYQPHPPDDTKLIEQLTAIAGKYKRYGSPRAHALLRRDGIIINHKRVERIWKEQGLSLPKRKKRKRCKKKQNVATHAEYPNHVWTYDFVHDTTHDGRKLKLLTVLDEFTRKSLAVEVERKMPAAAVIATLGQLFAVHGAPQYLRSDNGPEFVAKATQRWLKANDVQTRYIDPGSPWQNAYGESFNDKLRNECLNLEIFYSVKEAKILTNQWRLHYNNQRPHSSLGYLTPSEFEENYNAMNAGAQPPHPRSLSHFGLPASKIPGDQTGIDITKQGADLNQSSPLAVQPSATALGSLSSVALSSGRTDKTYQKPEQKINNNTKNGQTKHRILTL